MQHLVVDGFVDDVSRISEIAPIFELLDTLPLEIGMTKITQPYVFRYHGVVPEDWGITGMVIIAESHISIHTFPEHRRFHMDVFSCKPFDSDGALRLIEARLGVVRRAADVIRRPVLGEEVEAAGEMHWRFQQLPAGLSGAVSVGSPVASPGPHDPAAVHQGRPAEPRTLVGAR
ncbi:MAG TPA: S-adenosylmethionine decarboxylase [Chloroflexota bacterium]|nr:S-adenosylmethionine decarboxylase [Chloroflexota bacterium]